MSRKKVFLLLISLVLISLFPNVVSAQEEGGGIGEGLGSAFETIRELFGFLPELITSEDLMKGEPAAKFWAKFLIWLLLFAVVYFGTSAIPGLKESRNISIVIAIVISLMGALLIPDGVVFNIFQTYGFVAAVIVWVIPLVAGIWIAHKFENRFIRAIIYILAAVILGFINAGIVSNWGELGTKAFPYFALLMAATIFMAIWNIIGVFGGGERQESFANRILDHIPGFGRGDRGQFPEPDTQGFLDRRRQRGVPQTEEEIREMERLEGQQQQLIGLNGRLENVRRQLNRQIRRTRGFEVEDLNRIANLINELIQLENEIRALRQQPSGGT